MSTTTLRTGATVATPTLMTTTAIIAELWAKNPIAAFELATLARNPDHVPFGDTADVFARFGLTDHAGRLHTDSREIVLASFDGDDVDLHLVDPIAEG